MTGDGLVRIRQALPTLRPAEARIAEAVLADPTAVVGSTINELAARAGASQATVVRFCRAIGYAGYPEFRIDLAQATSRREMEMERSNVAHGEINETDTAEDVVAKIAFHEARTIEETARMLDLAALEQVAAAVAAAPRVDVFGVGSSGLTGQDLAQKLQRIGLVCFASPDPHLQLQSAALLGPGAVDAAVDQLAGTAVLAWPSPWRLGPAEAALTAAWLDGWVASAVEQEPRLAEAADGYLRRRLAQVNDGVLSVTVDHADLLVLP